MLSTHTTPYCKCAFSLPCSSGAEDGASDGEQPSGRCVMEGVAGVVVGGGGGLLGRAR